MKEFIIEENEAGQRFDKYLAKLLREAPKSFFYKIFFFAWFCPRSLFIYLFLLLLFAYHQQPQWSSA